MDERIARVFAEALALPEPERAALAKRLIETLDARPPEDADQGWANEIDRRVEDIVSRKAKTLSWDEVRVRSFAKRRDGP